VSSIPQLTEKEAKYWLESLRTLDTKYESKPRKQLIHDARELCAELLSGLQEEELVDSARRRFEFGDIKLTENQQKTLVDWVSWTDWCR
jgi:hypothetical protein